MRVFVFGTGAVLLSACASDSFQSSPDLDRSATAVEYEIRLNGAPSDDIRSTIESSLLVYRRQESGAQSLGLLQRRAREDVSTIQKILRSQGYYQSGIEVDVDRVEALEPEPVTLGNTLGAVSDAVSGTIRGVAGLFRRDEEDESEQPDVEREGPPPGGFARVTIEIDPGPQFQLTRHDLLLIDSGWRSTPPVLPTAEQLGSPVGKGAVAEPILVAENRAQQMLIQNGRPYAAQRDRDSVADLEEHSIEVTTTIATGGEYYFGATRFEGAPSVEEAYLRTYIPYVPGERVDNRLLEEYQERLNETGLFDSVSVRLPEEPPRGDMAPVLVNMEERPPRTVAAGLEYATDTGAAVNLAFEHRNLGRENETLDAELYAGTQRQSLRLGFRKPQWRQPGQDFTAGLLAERRDDDVYTGYRTALTAGVEREVGDFWTLGAGGLAEYSVTENDETGDDEAAWLFGLPAFVEFDDRNDILNPTRGMLARADVTPFSGINDTDFVQFLKTELNARTYFDILRDEKYIFAVRGRLGSIAGTDITVEDVPDPRRFYAGGGGSVRGYADSLIGPLDDDDDPTGGLSVVEASAEIRATVAEDLGLGVVFFVDAGSVSEESYPTFEDGGQYAAGTGVRYFSPVGPIRFDLAFPLNPRGVDDSFQFYISIGQAF